MRLFNYRVRVRVKVVDLQDEVVVDYFVQAPSQCSATKHAMLRAEVTDILLSELWLQPLPEGQSFVFSTTEECP